MILRGERLVFYFQYITQEIGFMILFNNSYLFLIPVADFVLLESINKISCFLIKRKHTSSWTVALGSQRLNRLGTEYTQPYYRKKNFSKYIYYKNAIWFSMHKELINIIPLYFRNMKLATILKFYWQGRSLKLMKILVSIKFLSKHLQICACYEQRSLFCNQ